MNVAGAFIGLDYPNNALSIWLCKAIAELTKPHRFRWSDVVAGISVALLLIPQSMAYAGIAGLPAVHGLYAAMLPPIVAAFFVSSPYLQTGPVAMTAILSFGALSALATPMTPDYIGLAALLAIVVGVTRVLTGVLRVGFVAYLMSQPVLMGFTSAAAVLIIASQVPTALGVSGVDGTLLGGAAEAVFRPGGWSPTAILLAVGTMAVVSGGRKIHPVFPGVLVAVMLGTVYSGATGYEGAVLGSVPAGIPPFTLRLPWDQLRHLIVPGIVISLVGFAEPAAIARTMATKRREVWVADREFVSQGMANLAAGLTGGFPVGGSFSRTMVNVSAGGQSRWAGVVTGVAVLVFLPFAGVLSALPRAVLAGIVIAAVSQLVNLRSLVTLAKTSRGQAMVGAATFVLTLVLAPRIDLAVLLGIGFGIAVHLWRERRIQVLQRMDGDTLWLEVAGVLYFGSAARLEDRLEAELAAHPEATGLVLDLRRVGRIDYTSAAVIQRVATDIEEAGMTVRVIAAGPPQGLVLLERLLGPDSRWLESGEP